LLYGFGFYSSAELFNVRRALDAATSNISAQTSLTFTVSFFVRLKTNSSMCLSLYPFKLLIRGCSQYLETLCDLLYDDLRPRILHEPRLTVLCEVCTVLQALMVLDASTDNENGDDDYDEDSAEGSSDDVDDHNLPVKSNSDEKFSGKLGHRLQISHLLKMVLQDAQTRLFFKAQSVIQSDIRHFVPKVEDLAYPDVLVGMCFPYRERYQNEHIFFDQLQIKN
jgi:hypothetical protein